MLENTFCHIPGIGLKTERALWAGGVRAWEDVLHGLPTGLSVRREADVRRHAEESATALGRGDARYFDRRLPAGERWRLFGGFNHSVAYLDIETTGMGDPSDIITAIGLYDGRTVTHYVHDRDLDQFADDVGRFDLLVTYNGKRFDLPFIRRYLGLSMDQAHVDLMFVLRSLGYRGGLKGCERQLGIDRGILDGLDGFFAVLLWQEYRATGDMRALDTLLAYNALDVVNLETLMVLAYNMKLRGTPFAGSHCLASPAPATPPMHPDPSVIERIRRNYGWT